MRNSAEKQQGFVLVVVAGILIVLVGFVALGVDTGALYSARTKAQAAADAAALAGAFTFIVQPTDLQPDTAVAAAKAVAMQYSILGKPVLDGDIDVLPTTADLAAHRIPVVVRTSQPTYFAKALGLASADIRVEALAEAGEFTSNVVGNPKPFFLPNTIASMMAPCDACTANEVLIDPATHKPTTWGLLQRGAEMSIKPSDPKAALQPSLYYLIDFNGGGGGASELNGWIDGTIAVPPVACGTKLVVEKGNKVGLKKGLDDLLGKPPDDDYVDIGEYAINHGVHSDVSKALVTVPIWDTCGSGYCAGDIPPGPGGHPQIEVIGWGLVFLDGGDDPLVGHLINFAGCIGAGGGTGTGSGVVGGFPLRLVRVP